VTKSQKNTVFKKKLPLFDQKTPLFGLFVHFFAQIWHSGGTSAHFRKTAKIAKFPNLARVHTRALFRACRNTNFSRMKNSHRKKNKFFFHSYELFVWMWPVKIYLIKNKLRRRVLSGHQPPDQDYAVRLDIRGLAERTESYILFLFY
jgi:hypothetical protein